MIPRFVIAVFLFLSLGFLAPELIKIYIESESVFSSEEKTWTEWALADYKAQKKSPAEIVILGSSLVLTPVNLADAHFHKCTIDGAMHHKSDLLSCFINKRSKNTVDNFNFALPGLMPSDAYLITKFLLNKPSKPKLVVYGVGPRDFVDNLLASPTSTDPYRCLAKYLPEESADALYRSKDWEENLNYFLSRYFPVCGARENFLALLSKQSDFLYKNMSYFLFGKEEPASVYSIQQLHALLPTYNPMTIGINECLFQPVVHLDKDRFAKNLNEYRMRYGKLNWNTFTCQSEFFVRMLTAAQDNNVKVLVVAMPITSINRSLLPEYVFGLYKNSVKVLSESCGADFLDLDRSKCFVDQDFGDTVHLSTTGSAKMIKLISDYIVDHKLDKNFSVYKNNLAQTGMKL